MTFNYDLYLVTEESVETAKLLYIVEEAVHGGVSVVQLREKKSDGKIFYEKAVKLKELLSRFNVPLIINDRIDIALAVEADGVHVGQKDLPLQQVRKIVPPSMIVGVSVSNVEEALEAEKHGANYVGLGAVFPTKTKENANVLQDGMIEKVTDIVNIPVVAIGGINLTNLSLLKNKKLAGVAVVSGIMLAENPREAAESYLSLWKNQ